MMTKHPPYIQNNILFRIASADAISKFKAAQAHSLIQISRREFEFDNDAREVLLLSYDRMSTWVLRIERAFIAQDGAPITDDFKARIIDDLHELLTSIEDEFKNHAEVFSEAIAAYIKVIHCYSFPVLQAALMASLRDNINVSFQNTLEILTKYLQHLLISLHEFNNNAVLKRPPFICASEFSATAKDHELRLTPLQRRAEFFRDKYNVKTFIIKNYTDEELEAEIIDALGQLGVMAKIEVR
jgi:hypothetical protein